MKSKPPAADPRRAEFEALYQRHGREVWALAYARWMDADAALDIAQEAFLRLWRHWEAGAEDLQNPRAWLLRVARNLAEDYAKSAFRRNGTTPPAIMNGVKSRDPQPLDDMERAEAFAAIRSTLEELPPGDRDLLTLRYALEYDAAQIAEVLGINATAVHMRLSRARQRLADKLTAQGDDENTMTKPTSDEQVDRLLGDYFKAQLPAPWPPAPRTDRARPAERKTTDPAVRSRWALAASVAVLIGGCWYLSGTLDTGKARKGVGLDNGTATQPNLDQLKPKPEPKVGMP